MMAKRQQNIEKDFLYDRIDAGIGKALVLKPGQTERQTPQNSQDNSNIFTQLFSFYELLSWIANGYNL